MSHRNARDRAWQAAHRGPDWLSAERGVPTRAVSRVLACHQVPRLTALDPITGQVIRASKTTAVRYERDHPGELVHMDVKKLGRIPDDGGWGHTGRDRNTKIGFDFVHSLVDDHSRLACSEVLPRTRRTPTHQPTDTNSMAEHS